jgi:signal transduction histidine kinase
MARRAQRLDGTLEITTADGLGTTIKVDIPT